MSLPSHFTPTGSSKVAIPRLLNKRSELPKKSNAIRHPRAARACMSCRARKIKCNGATPTCSNCSDASTSCTYATSRKDRFKTSTTQNQAMMALLRELRPQVSENGRNKIDDLLITVSNDVVDAAATIKRSPKIQPPPQRRDEGEEEQGEANVSAEVGSSADLDLVDEDLLEDERTRATGFIGKASEIQWLRQFHTEEGKENSDGPFGPPGSTEEAASERVAALRQRQEKQDRAFVRTSKASFFLDDEIFELDLEVDPYELPSFDIAEKMVQTYMESCHNSFPFIMKKAFVNQFYHYYAALRRGEPYRLAQKWQAQLNLVFAVAAVYSHLTVAEWRGDERDHLIYHSRASALSMKDPWWFSHPDLPQMQILGLLSLYYLSIGHVNRSWILAGMGIRFGQALGMHVRNEDRATGAARKEELARVWWAYFGLDRHLATITGRPSIEFDKSCSVPLPLPLSSSEIEETIIESRYGDRITMSASIFARRGAPNEMDPNLTEKSPSSSTSSRQGPVNSGLYLKKMVELSELSKEVMDLYTSRTTSQSWLSVQETIADLVQDLETWAATLPDGFRFLQRTTGTYDRYNRERNVLEMLYHSTRILVTRPCLCRLDRRIRNQTARSSEFNEGAARACVASAKAFAGLLPGDSELNIRQLYECGPWWSIVHSIMQSLVILLLDVSLDPESFPQDRQAVVPALKKLVRWLRTMSTNNRMAKRAYPMVMDTLRKLLVNIPMDISDILQEDEVVKAAAAVVAISTPTLEVGDSSIREHRTTTAFPQVNNPVSSIPTPSPLNRQFHHSNSHYQDMVMSDPNIDPMMGMPPFPTDSRDLPRAPLNDHAANRTYTETFAESWRSPGSMFPGLFLTSFDELSPIPGLTLEDFEVGRPW